MSESLLLDLQRALGDDGMVKMTWNRVNGWCIIATNSEGRSFAGKDQSLSTLAARCIEILKVRTGQETS